MTNDMSQPAFEEDADNRKVWVKLFTAGGCLTFATLWVGEANVWRTYVGKRMLASSDLDELIQMADDAWRSESEDV